MNTKIILQYLSDLERNNEKEWYHDHKAELKTADGEFLEILKALMLEMGKHEPNILDYEPKDLTFKLVRDTRFSNDKSPYNPAFRAHISQGGKMPVPAGLFLVMKPGNGTFLGGGLFADMFKDATEMVRKFLASHGEEWEAIINDAEFKKYFTVKGSALKNVPAGFDKDHPQAEYLKYKSWYLEYFVEDELVLDCEGFITLALKMYGIMKPFNDFLNRALVDFRMPARP